MLESKDIEFMRQARREIMALRTHEVELIYTNVIGKHPITKEEITEDVADVVPAVVTEISGLSGSAIERIIREGIEIRDGDIWFSVDLDYISPSTTKYTSVIYAGERYEIVAADRKGIGIRNRIEFLARLSK